MRLIPQIPRATAICALMVIPVGICKPLSVEMTMMRPRFSACNSDR